MNPRDMSLRTRFFLLVALGSIFTATAAYLLNTRERNTTPMAASKPAPKAPARTEDSHA